jgi:hypothetical protein
MPPPPVIVLCPPRSFSSMTAAMLGQHPNLYAFPELNLFLADTLGELIDWESEVGPERGYLGGLRRTIAQLEFGEQSAIALGGASDWLENRREWSTMRTFHCLVERVAPRAVVDKSTRTAMARRSCRRLLATVPNGRYLHLTRHPVASIRSLASKVREEGSHVNRFFAQVWLNCQQTIIELTETLEQQQTLRVRGEDLLGNPEQVLRDIALWLGLPASRHEIELMRHPERWSFAYSLPDLYQGDNDAGFLASPQLRPLEQGPDAEEISALDLGKGLTEQILSVGHKLGYDQPIDPMLVSLE